MKLKFLDIDSNVSKPKATIHITGKLGFNMEAAKLMKLSDATYYRIAIDEEIESINIIYLVSSTLEERGAIKVAKAGNYYYINLGSTFTKLDLKYEERIISFDISKTSYDEKEVFVLKKRKKERLRDAVNDKDDE